MDVRGLEVVAQGEHGQQRRIACLVAEVVAELTAGELRTAVGLGSNKFGVALAAQVVTHEGERNAAEVGTATEAADDNVGVFACHLHLLLSLETDNGLMESDVVEHGSEGVFAVGRSGCQLNGLADGGAE